MGAIDVKDVQAKIAEMLEAVEQGQTLAITRDGKAFATLEPAPQQKRLPSLAEFRASLKINQECTGNTVVEMREQPSGTVLDALQELRGAGGLRELIPDPVAWQQESRKDRTLPGRD